MTNNVDHVSLGKPKVGGAIFKAPLGTVIPTDASTPLVPAFIPQGYVSDEGVAREISKSFSSQKAWGGDEVANSKTEETVRLNFTLIESSNPEALKSAYGDDAVTVAGDLITIDYKGDEPDDAVWVVDMEYKGVLRRIVLLKAANVTEDFTQTFSDEELVGLPFSLAAYKSGGSFFRDMIEGSATVTDTVWDLAVTSATGGSYSLLVNGYATAPIAHDGNATAVQNAINGISGVTGITATVTGTSTKEITFSGAVYAVANGLALEGEGAAVSVVPGS